MKNYVFSKRFVVSLLLFTLIFSITSVYANHRYDNYPSRGYVWMSKDKNYNGNIAVYSPCKPEENTAFNNVVNSTSGTTEMSRWSDGINMNLSCPDQSNGSWEDIKIVYSDFSQTHGGGTYGGENHSFLAPTAWCEYQNVSYPCGSHPSEVHINQTKWNNTSTSGRVRLIMHETSHSMGLAHHCAGDSITNNGTSACNGGKWTAIMEYTSTDRTGIDLMYAQ